MTTIAAATTAEHRNSIPSSLISEPPSKRASVGSSMMLPVQPLDKGSALPETIAGTAPLSGTIAATEDASRRGEGNEKDLDLELGAGASAGGGRGAAEDNGEGRHSLSRAVSGPRPEEGESEVDGEMRPRLPTSRIVLLAIMMLMTFFIGAASSSSVTLLIPSIARTLNTNELEAQWVASAYTLAFGCGLLFSGRLADIYGRRTLYLVGLGSCAIFAMLTGIIRNLIAICLFRALAGLSLAIASSSGFGIIGTNVRHEPARTVVFATFGVGNPVGSACGTLIGGGIAGTGGDRWAYLFFLLMGLCLLIGILAFFFVPKDPVRAVDADKRVDWIGGALVSSSICLFTFSLTASGSAPNGWRTPYVPALFATSFILLTLFILWSKRLERTSYPPIIKMSLFSRHHYRISYVCATAFFACLSVSGWIMTTSLFYQTYEGLDPLGNAIKILPSSAIGVLAAASMMYLAPRVRAPHLIFFGMILTSVASLLYAVRPEGTNYFAMEFPANLMMPWGIDYAVGLGNIFMSNLLRQNEQSTGGGLYHTSAQTGAALGICLTALIANQRPGIEGLRAAFWFCFASGFVVVGLVFVGLRKVRLAKDIAKVD